MLLFATNLFHHDRYSSNFHAQNTKPLFSPHPWSALCLLLSTYKFTHLAEGCGLSELIDLLRCVYVHGIVCGISSNRSTRLAERDKKPQEKPRSGRESRSLAAELTKQHQFVKSITAPDQTRLIYTVSKYTEEECFCTMLVAGVSPQNTRTYVQGSTCSMVKVRWQSLSRYLLFAVAAASSLASVSPIASPNDQTSPLRFPMLGTRLRSFQKKWGWVEIFLIVSLLSPALLTHVCVPVIFDFPPGFEHHDPAMGPALSWLNQV